MDPLEILPMEIWKMIYNFLSPKEKYHFGLTCQDFKFILEEDDKITLHLSQNSNDTELKFFSNCKSLVIHNEDLTSDQLKFFSNVENLNLSHCTILNPEDIYEASLRCTSLALYGEACINLNENLIHLQKLSLTDSTGTEKDILHLTNLEYLRLEGCDNFTGENLSSLTKLKKLELIACSRFTQSNLSKLTYLTDVKVTNCSEIYKLPKGVEGKLVSSPHLTSTNNSYMQYHIAPYSEESAALPFIGM